jgi:hypothetical protein
MSAHSNVVGGSTAARLIACPGSVAAIAALPDAVDKPSIYASEGSALHTVIADLLTDSKPAEDYLGAEVDVPQDNATVVITQELLSDCILPALDWFDANVLDDDVIMVEQKVKFPNIEGAFGTCDLIVCSPSRLVTKVNDWKFGAGVPVKAAYPDPEDPEFELINPQLLFYACGGRNSHPKLFPKDHKIELSIVQPRARTDEERGTKVTVTHEDLDAFERDLVAAIAIAGQPNAPIKKGDHCRFAVCRTTCPLHLAPLLDLADLYPLEDIKGKPVTGDVIADILRLAEQVEPLITEARKQAHDLLEAANPVPGWKLVPKRASRSWAADEFAVIKALRKLKITKAQAMTYSLKSPTQIEKLLPKDVPLPEQLVAKVSSGTTIAKDNDARAGLPAVGDTVAELLGVIETAEAAE